MTVSDGAQGPAGLPGVEHGPAAGREAIGPTVRGGRRRSLVWIAAACVVFTTTTAAIAAVSFRARTDTDSMHRAVAEVSRFVEEQRGLRFRRSVQVELLDDDAMKKHVWSHMQAHRETADELTGMLVALGLLPSTADYFTQMSASADEAVVGLYDFKNKSLYLRGQSVTPYVRAVLAHELTHALDDQWFGLHRPERLRPDAVEAASAFAALGDGSARRVEIAYRASLSMQDQAAAVNEERRIAKGQSRSSALSPVVERLGANPYIYGTRLVTAIVANGGQKGLDWAFKHPPTTTEQVMFPSEYFANDRPVTVADEPPAKNVVGSGVLGVEILNEMLSTDPDHAAPALRGWGGDHYVIRQDATKLYLRAFIVGDAPGDTREIFAALKIWAEKHPSATVTMAGPRIELNSWNRR